MLDIAAAAASLLLLGWPFSCFAQFGAFAVATVQRGNDFFRRTIEKGFDKVLQRGTAGDVQRNYRNINVPQTLFQVPDVSFFFQHAELRANRRVVGAVGKPAKDFADGNGLKPEHDVHDQAFAAERLLSFGSFAMVTCYLYSTARKIAVCGFRVN